MDAPGRAALRRILAACARRTPSVGYCQGLNFLAATFLLLLPEEDAFWCLCALVEDLLGPSYFDERMVAPQVGRWKTWVGGRHGVGGGRKCGCAVNAGDIPQC